MLRKVLLVAALSIGLAGTSFGQDDPTDPQIAHIAYTAGQIDIAAAEQALRKSSKPVIIEFAETMVRDHQAVNEQALALVEKLGVTPEENPTSQSLAQAAETKTVELEQLEGEEFDSAYIANEAAYHEIVNDALSGLLIPSAENAELRALLETGHQLFLEHQAHAEHLATEVK